MASRDDASGRPRARSAIPNRRSAVLWMRRGTSFPGRTRASCVGHGIDRAVDRFVARAFGSLVGVIVLQPTDDLLRGPPTTQAFHDLSSK